MLANTAELLSAAQAGGYALGGFNVYNLEGVNAVISAAESNASSALLQVHPGALEHGGLPLLALCVSAADLADVPIAVHLDHCAEANIIAQALDMGVSSVMADGSHLDYDKNVAFVREATEAAAAKHITVEGELGRISGTEDGLTVEAVNARMTDPEQAVDFVAQTGVHMLAVCIGNVHGPYPFPPQLDFERLAAIRERVGVPLVLHGASGLPEEQVKRSIELGVCKFNVNTEVRRAFVNALRSGTESDLVPMMLRAQDAMQAVITQKMQLFGSVDRA